MNQRRGYSGKIPKGWGKKLEVGTGIYVHGLKRKRIRSERVRSKGGKTQILNLIGARIYTN